MSGQIVDTHVHFWNLENNSHFYQTFPTKAMTPIFQSFSPDDYKTEMEESKIRYALHVQVAHLLEENSITSQLVEEHPFLAGYVGWIDLENPDHLSTLDRLKHDSFFKGIRHQLHETQYNGWLENRQVMNSLAALAQHDLTFDAIIKTESLRELLKPAQQIPHLKTVINHCGMPNTRSVSTVEEWRQTISLLAQYPNITIKLSGLAECIGRTDSDSLEPYFAHCLREFGPQRCLFGSNWPVCRLAEPGNLRLNQLRELLEYSLKEYSAEERQMVMSDNAVRVYNLKLRPY